MLGDLAQDVVHGLAVAELGNERRLEADAASGSGTALPQSRYGASSENVISSTSSSSPIGSGQAGQRQLGERRDRAARDLDEEAATASARFVMRSNVESDRKSRARVIAT